MQESGVCGGEWGSVLCTKGPLESPASAPEMSAQSFLPFTVTILTETHTQQNFTTPLLSGTSTNEELHFKHSLFHLYIFPFMTSLTK